MPPHAPMEAWPDAKKSWSHLYADFAKPKKGISFLILVDLYSKWPEVFHMKSSNASSTIRALGEAFSRFGLPDTLITNNGPPFQSQEFQTFCLQNGIQHLFSPVYHTQSNGLAERFVDTFERASHKMNTITDEAKIRQFLFHYRNFFYSLSCYEQKTGRGTSGSRTTLCI